MTTKEQLHRLVDDLSEVEAARALVLIRDEREDPVIAAFRDVDESTQAQNEDAGRKEAQGTDTPSVRVSEDSPKTGSYDHDTSGSEVGFREGGESPTGNPDFSVAGLSPAFTQPSAPPPQPPDKAVDAQRDARIRELERLLERASEQIERGAAVLERSRRRR